MPYESSKFEKLNNGELMFLVSKKRFRDFRFFHDLLEEEILWFDLIL